MLLELLGTAAGLGAASASAVAAGAGWAWRASGLGSSRRRAGRAVRPFSREAQRITKELAAHERRATASARAYAAELVSERLREVPIESLREAGASNVRWSALEDAGYRTLADVEGVPARQLAAVHGVGAKTATRVVKAAREVAKRVRSEPPRLPDAELSEATARELAERTIDLLDVREAGGEAGGRVIEKAADFERRLEQVRRETRFRNWLLGPFRRESNQQAIERAEALAGEADVLGKSGLIQEAAEGRKRIRSWKRPGNREATLSRFRDRYADCCALLEELFGRAGLRPGPSISRGQGGLTDEVARRVEAFQLRAGRLRATLRRYQEFGAKYVLAQRRTILGDEMGLGKTMQALAAMTHLDEETDTARFFVVAPAGLLINWSREIEKFTPLTPHILHGDDLEANLASWVTGGGVAITSYATLRNVDIGAALEQVGATVVLCAVDEAHFIKNPEAGRTQAVRRLLERSEHTVLLSGTPMENHPSEFLHLIDAIRPDDAADLRDQDLDLDAVAGSVRAFHRAVAKIYLRRNQEDVLTELPEKIEVEEWVELLPQDLGAYREMVREGNFMGMRRTATMGEADTTSAKLDHLADLLEDHRSSGRKVIIFSFFLDVLAACAKRFETVGTISGKVSPEGKQELCDEFQSREGHAILLLQINAGGQGLNLQKASAVVLMEPQTKPSIEAQAVARAHRMGQTNPVIVHRLLARGTCDESMLLVLAEKSELFEAYARQSLVKDASSQATEAKEATEASLARAVVEAERRRLDGEEPGPRPEKGENTTAGAE